MNGTMSGMYEAAVRYDELRAKLLRDMDRVMTDEGEVSLRDLVRKLGHDGEVMFNETCRAIHREWVLQQMEVNRLAKDTERAIRLAAKRGQGADDLRELLAMFSKDTLEAAGIRRIPGGVYIKEPDQS